MLGLLGHWHDVHRLLNRLPIRIVLPCQLSSRHLCQRVSLRHVHKPLCQLHWRPHNPVLDLHEWLSPLWNNLRDSMPRRHLPERHHLPFLQRQLRHLLHLCLELHQLRLHGRHSPVRQHVLQFMPQRHIRLVFLGLHRLHLALRQLHVCLDHRLHQLRVHPAASLWDDLLHHVPRVYVRLQLDAVLQLHLALLDLLWIGHLVPVLRLWHLPLWLNVCVYLPRRLLHLGHFLRPVLLHVRQLHHHGHDLHQLPVHRIDPPLLERVLCHLPHWYVPLVDVGLLSVYYSLLGMHIGHRLHQLHLGQLPLADRHVCILVPQWLLRQRLQLPLLRLLLPDVQWR